MTESALRVATVDAYVLAEGPFWDAPRERLLWVDIESGLVLAGHLAGDGTIQEIERVAFDGKVGAVAVAADGDWIVAVDGRLVRRRPTGELEDGPVLVAPGTGRRLNDGKPDPAGRYVVGSLRMDGPSHAETLAVVDERGIRTLDDDLTLSNGLAWSVDGTVLYSIDTERRTVFRRPWDAATGASGPRTTHLTLADGYPDGMTIDAEDHLWIAVWGLGRVHRYSPAGALVRVVDVPAPFTSSVGFAGPDLGTLVITTSHRDHDADGRAAYPDAGRLFTTRPGVRGAPQPLWSGVLAPR
ncbi:SMP-30/gluconolactonase/LRE family protein [Agromyces sp. MMS24-JH15]|uniref:SMP-30/gluconolactonase/LRE family protein n=1 Tax=Agromyces sp. MMS24-JH15 TaxID=3243765 RepID=UPI003748D183